MALSGQEPACQCRRHKTRGFDPRVGKIPWRRAWQPTPVFSLACRIPRTEEPGGLQSMGSQRVGHDWSDLAYTRATHVLLSQPQSAHKCNCCLSQMTEYHPTHQSQNRSQIPSSLAVLVRPRDPALNALCKAIPIFQSWKAVFREILFFFFLDLIFSLLTLLPGLWWRVKKKKPLCKILNIEN